MRGQRKKMSLELTKETLEELRGSGITMVAAAEQLDCNVQTMGRRMKDWGMGGWLEGRHLPLRRKNSDDAEEGCEADSAAAEHNGKESEQKKKGAGSKLCVCPAQPMKDFIVFLNQRSSTFWGMVGRWSLLKTGEIIIVVQQPSTFLSSHNGRPQRLRQMTTSSP